MRLHEPGARHPLAAAAAETRGPRMRLRGIDLCLGWMSIPPGGPLLPPRRLRRRVFLHEGGTGGFRSFAAFGPEARVGAVVLANQRPRRRLARFADASDPASGIVEA
jgi:serine-type D-Ala-D-Ala carboxypeptidase/endopeptidase